MPTASTRWWPTGWPWRQWQRARELENRRDAWAANFFASEVAGQPDLVERSELGAELDSPPDWLRVNPVDEMHDRALKELVGSWLAVKVCARRLPSDPIGAGLDVLDGLVKRGGELRAQADHVRPIAEDRAPDGGRWHPWAMSNPESGMDPGEAARRDVDSGQMGRFVELVDEGVSDVRKAVRRTQWIAKMAHFVPLLALAVVVAVAESIFADGIALAILVGLSTFLIVDRIVIARVVEPVIEGWQRRLLDAAADDLGEELGEGAAAAALIRQSMPR